MLADEAVQPGVAELWTRFEKHLRLAVDTIAAGLDVHMAHMHDVLPELVLDLLCYGPVEKGLDASHGGVEFYNLCVDGSALATVADSFAAIEQRIEREGRMSWAQLLHNLDGNWGGQDGARARLMMRNIPRYGSGGSRADDFAARISQCFTHIVKEKPTPDGFNMIPGLFSWANTIPMGKGLGATPNGRYAGDPISHGANPDPGYRKDGAPTAMAVAIAGVQPGYGNTAPMQIEFDPGITREQGGVEHVAQLIRTHFELGGTQINMNIMDVDKVLEAHKDPAKYPDLVVRVTGFSAYFASLSPEFRQLVVDRILAA
jgi:formate C-acetyltransferase